MANPAAANVIVEPIWFHHPCSCWWWSWSFSLVLLVEFLAVVGAS
jgi:hypothetical protein